MRLRRANLWLVLPLAVFALVAGHVGLSEEKIRIVSPDIGGGFGGGGSGGGAG